MSVNLHYFIIYDQPSYGPHYLDNIYCYFIFASSFRFLQNNSSNPHYTEEYGSLLGSWKIKNKKHEVVTL